MNLFLSSSYLAILLVGLLLALYFLFNQIKRKRDLENSLIRLKKKVLAKEATPQDYYSLGSIYLSRKFFDQAILYFSYSLVEWDKTDVDGLSALYNAVGFTYFESDQLDMSIYYYQKAIDIKPTYITALNNLGNSYEKKRMLDQAQDAYKRALTLDNNNSIANERLQSLSKKVRISG